MKKRFLTGWMIALINVAAICNVKNFPLLAEYGLSIISFLFLSALFFFIPVAFVSAELAAAWPERGIYTWVKEAFGSRLAFFAIWLQWASNVLWYPTILSFIAGTAAYAIDPQLATNPTFIFCAVLGSFWLFTWLNFFGMRLSGWISVLSALLGTLLPIAVIILFGVKWMLGHHALAFHWSLHSIFPRIDTLNELVLLSGVLLGLAGLEMSAVHAQNVRNPKRDYPLGIFVSAFLILLLSSLGALSIASVIPQSEIELTSASMRAFSYFFAAFELPWMTPLLAAITTFGAVGMLSTWIAGPSRGLLAAAVDGDLPLFLHKANRFGAPTALLTLQAILVSLLASLFLFMPSVNSSYWTLLALASILYQLMYLLFFFSFLRLRRMKKNQERPYRVPGGRWGAWIIGGCGIAGSSFGFFFAFFPPAQFNVGKLLLFESFLIVGMLFFCAIPFWIYRCRKRVWKEST
ncbi:MAG: amino acid permease [Verrucomicrobiota bacterium]|nr:amino acid permease [Verrucomicrobiota bacterium]